MATEQNNNVSDSRVKMLDENVSYMHFILQETEVIQLFQEAINTHLEAFGDTLNEDDLKRFHLVTDEVFYYLEYLKSIFAVTQYRKTIK